MTTRLHNRKGKPYRADVVIADDGTAYTHRAGYHNRTCEAKQHVG